jgi:transketolase
MLNTGVGAPLDPTDFDELRQRASRARRSVLTATTVAASGHPGGSLSSMEMYTLLYGTARLRHLDPRWPGRDRIVISHGHTSPGAYCALAEAGFFDAAAVEAHFRQAGSVFEGHVERSVPGIEWSTGNLGQGLSAGVGLALGARLAKESWSTYVVMSDGEQQKGQVGEARRLAVKYGLSNVTALVDVNGIQISGHTADVMPVPIAKDWQADGWRVYECDGHDLEALHSVLEEARSAEGPCVVLARTLIGKGVSFMEDDAEFHGRALNPEEYARAMAELGGDVDRLGAAVVARAGECTVEPLEHRTSPIALDGGTPREYDAGSRVDNRSAWGRALTDVAEANPELPLAVFDCDLAVSVKTDGFAALRPDGFIQCGVGEHTVATAAGALSTIPGVLSVWSDFGAFGIDETYNQQRLNDINGAGLKLVVTHCGLDVGEDGKTHQCLDYVGAFRDQFGWSVIVPADANQTDRAIREALAMQGNVVVAMGRSKLDVLVDSEGRPLFGGGYRFEYGRIDWARDGGDACVLAMGTVAGAAIEASDRLRRDGVELAVGIVSSPLSLDDEAMTSACATGIVLSVEDHGVGSGLGASVAAWMAQRGSEAVLTTVGVRAYQSSGSARDVLARAGLDVDGIAAAVRAAIGRTR